MDKRLLFWLVFAVIIATSLCVVLLQRNPKYVYKQGTSTEVDTAVGAATKLFKEQTSSLDLQNGPCLTNDLIPNWVADIVHNPRTAADDLSENQCQAYIEGRAKHFVELDQQGIIVRIK